MMKYLKAEAEIIKFDNSDVVTASNDYQESVTCGYCVGYQCRGLIGAFLGYPWGGSNYTCLLTHAWHEYEGSCPKDENMGGTDTADF